MLGTTNISTGSMNNLSISINGTNVLTYNGKESKNLDITPSKIGAADSNHTHDYLPLTGGTLSGTLYAGDGIRVTNSIPYIDFHFNNSLGMTSSIVEFESGALQLNNTFTIIKNQGSYNFGWFHVHDGEINKYIDNDNIFTREFLWKSSTTGEILSLSDVGFATPKWSGYRIQRYPNNPEIDLFRCDEEAFTRLGYLTRCDNYNAPNIGPIYLGEQNKHIEGIVGGWIHLSYSTYINGQLDLYGPLNVLEDYYQENNKGGIAAMQSAAPNVKMLWAY